MIHIFASIMILVIITFYYITEELLGCIVTPLKQIVTPLKHIVMPYQHLLLVKYF